MKTNITTKRTAALAVTLLGTLSFNALCDQAAMPASPEKSYTGDITSVNAQARVFTVKSWWLSKKVFNLGDNCACVMADNSNGSPADLRPGEKVTVRYQTAQGVRVADRIEQEPMRFEGTVAAIGPGTHSLTLHRPGLDKELRIAKGCNVMLRDNRTGTLNDIHAGDHVTVTYETPSGLPTARQIALTDAEFVGKLTAIDLNDKTVKATGVFSTMNFSLADNCTIVVNGRTDGKLSELKPDEKLAFDYEPINGVNVVNRIGPAPEQTKKSPLYTTVPPYPAYPDGY